MRSPKISWSTEGIEEISAQMDAWKRRTGSAQPAFDQMANTLLDVQKRWWATKGNGTWAPRKEPYRSWMRRNYPSRPTLRGPDRPNHKGLQLRNQLTRRPFGFEQINSQGLQIGSTLDYAVYHQEGKTNMPARPPLKPLDGATEKKLTDILAGHIFQDRMSRTRASGKNALSKNRSFGRRRR